MALKENLLGSGREAIKNRALCYLVLSTFALYGIIDYEGRAYRGAAQTDAFLSTPFSETAPRKINGDGELDVYLQKKNEAGMGHLWYVL